MARRLAAAAALLVATLLPQVGYAAAVDVAVSAADISISPELAEYPAGMAVRIYVKIRNLGQEDTVATATLRATLGDGSPADIGQASPVPVRAGGSAETWLDWVVPGEPFRLQVSLAAAGDASRKNDSAETESYAVAVPEGRDIFSPPADRNADSAASSTPLATSTLEASGTAPEQQPPAAQPPATPPAAERQPAAGMPLDDYAWVPYVLIAIGAAGFAWGMRGRRRSVARIAPVAPAPVARARAVRPRRVYKPKLVVEAAAPRARRAPRRKPQPPAAPQEPAA